MIIDDSELYSCPYCGSDNYLTIDPTSPKRQKTVVDCEICCQPILIEISAAGEIFVRRENE